MVALAATLQIVVIYGAVERTSRDVHYEDLDRRGPRDDPITYQKKSCRHDHPETDEQNVGLELTPQQSPILVVNLEMNPSERQDRVSIADERECRDKRSPVADCCSEKREGARPFRTVSEEHVRAAAKKRDLRAGCSVVLRVRA